MHPAPGYRSLSELSRSFAQKSTGLKVEDFVALDGALGLGCIQRKSSLPELGELAAKIAPVLHDSLTVKPLLATVHQKIPAAFEETKDFVGRNLRGIVGDLWVFVLRSMGWLFDAVLVCLSLSIAAFVMSKTNPQASDLLNNWMASGNIFEVVAGLILAICAVFLTYRFSFFLILGRTLGDSMVGWIRSGTAKAAESGLSLPETPDLIR